MADRSIVAEMREFVKGVNRFMLEKVIVSLEKEAAEDKIKELREKLAPVSYTHLDVYKRQLFK